MTDGEQVERGGAEADGDANSSASKEALSSECVLSSTERWSIAGLSSLQGALFLWAAVALPWQSVNWFSLLAGLLGCAHLAVVTCLIVRPAWAPTAWKVSALVATLMLLVASVQVFSGGAYLSGLYGSLGEGLFAALLAIWGQLVLLTLPTSCWALARTRHAAPRLGRLPWIGTAGALLLVAASSLLAHGQGTTSPLANSEGAESKLQRLSDIFDKLGDAPDLRRRTGKQWRVSRRSAAECEVPPARAAFTLIATFTRRVGPGYDSLCAQAEELDSAIARLRRGLLGRAARSAIKLDLLTGVASTTAGPDWLSVLNVRPALDGVCLANRCWMPWQLLARNAFIQNQPLSFLQDLKFGVDLIRLDAELRSENTPAEASLQRVTTQSWLLHEDRLVRVERLRPVEVDLDADALRAAQRAAEAHIVEAQLDDGKFRYLLHPFSQYEQRKNFNLARQAGTLLVLCELGSDNDELDGAIRRGLELLASYEEAEGNVSGLTMDPGRRRVQLGDSALPLTAFIQCRTRVGSTFDATLKRLTRLIVALQRKDGSFAPEFDLDSGKAISGPEPLYAPGQSILALALLESAVRRAPIEGLPDATTLQSARLRAMDHVAHHHWPSSLYPFFFVEENWNCLAARAALSLQRDPDYERFCLDYIAFKSRIILEEDSDVDPNFVGGFGFGNVIPPHNTGAAGFGEALAAAISVKRAQGRDVTRDQELLRKVMTFLKRQQWTEDNCFGCNSRALGSLSEHTHSPITRIDFVQHAWAAWGHGERALAL